MKLEKKNSTKISEINEIMKIRAKINEVFFFDR